MSRIAVALFVAAVACLGRPAPAAAQDAKVYAVLVLDTNADENLKKAIDKDREIVHQFLRGGIGQNSLVLSELAGDKVTLKQLRSHVGDLPIRPGVDTLFCYIAAHGGTATNNDDKHFFQFNGAGKEEVLREVVREALTDAKPRLTILLSDSCSNKLAMVKQKKPVFGVLAPAKVKPVAELPPTNVRALPGYETLFFDTVGIVDINASRTGDYAWFSDVEGGIFTRALGDAFACNKNKKGVNWTTFYQDVKTMTNETYAEWRKGYKDSLGKAGAAKLKGDELKNYQLLDEQKSQLTQAFYLDGVRLKLVVERTEGDKGVTVVELPENSPAAAAGVKMGDLIVAVNGKKVFDVEDFVREGGAVLGASPEATVELKITVRRANGKEEVLRLNVPPLPKK